MPELPKPFTATNTDPRHDLFAAGLQTLSDRDFGWARAHYENQAIRWGTVHNRELRDMVRAEAKRREDEQRGQAA